jgi:hypothetical protein
VSEMAAANVMRLEGQSQESGSSEMQASLLSEQGVFAANENDWPTARRDFMQAYALDPTNAFSLNNRGYVAEHDGDLESANSSIRRPARLMAPASRRARDQLVGKGQALSRVAAQSRLQVDGALDVYSRERRGQPGSIELTPRGAAAAGESTVPPQQPSSQDAPLPEAAPQDHP